MMYAPFNSVSVKIIFFEVEVEVEIEVEVETKVETKVETETEVTYSIFTLHLT